MTVRIRLVREGFAAEEDFSAYDALDILPTHVHRPKGDHTQAIVVLGDCLSRLTRGERSNWHLAEPGVLNKVPAGRL